MENKKESLLLSFVLFLAGMLFLISASIALPILCRPFYYAQIEKLGLTGISVIQDEGMHRLTKEEIVEAYDDVLDYCCGITNSFRAGILRFSEEGAAHFADCRVLFLLDFKVLAASGAVILLWFILKRRLPVRPKRTGGRGPGFWSGVGVLALFAVIGIGAAVDFDRFFVLFHHVFFPGKTNWLFDGDVDQVINILPEELFANFGIAIVGLIVCGALALILADLCRNKKKKTAA